MSWGQKVNLTILVSDALKNLFYSINRNCESIICVVYVLEFVCEYYISQLILCCTVTKSQNMWKIGSLLEIFTMLRSSRTLSDFLVNINWMTVHIDSLTFSLSGVFFSRYRGGLDTMYGQTGSDSVFARYQGREIMFHVSTLLPFTDGDPQQVTKGENSQKSTIIPLVL